MELFKSMKQTSLFSNTELKALRCIKAYKATLKSRKCKKDKRNSKSKRSNKRTKITPILKSYELKKGEGKCERMSKLAFKLSLNEKFFTKSREYKHGIRVEKEEGKPITVYLPPFMAELLEAGYVGVGLSKEDKETALYDFDLVLRLSKSTWVGFYK